MVSVGNPPADWRLESEETRHDSMMGRDFTTVIYRQQDTCVTVRINEVLEPRTSVWGFLVHHSGRNSELGVAEDLGSAKQLAQTYMEEHSAA